MAPAVYGQAATDNTLTAAETSAGWQLLFDGKTIDKWRGYNTKEIPAFWSIVDGAITAAKGKGADLVSVDEYGDFELAVDFKVAKNGNSGIFYRGVESPTGPIYHSAPEYQVLDDIGHPDAKNGPDRFCGANYAIDPPLVARLQAGRRVELGEDRGQGRARRALAERQEDGRLRAVVAGVEGQGGGQQVQGVAGLRHGQERPPRRCSTTATKSPSRTSRCGP